MGGMIVATSMWSTAGVVTRHLHGAGSFEATFWRSFFNAVALVVLLGALRDRRTLAATLRHGGATLWLSGVCWALNALMSLARQDWLGQPPHLRRCRLATIGANPSKPRHNACRDRTIARSTDARRAPSIVRPARC
jgi:hypothetical protein